MNKRAAVIDLGTNTFHLIVANLTDQVEVIYKTNLPVKLGEGRLNDNIIIPEAFERGLQALKQFREEMIRYEVDIVKATATSAIRSASNGADFVRAAKETAGIDIEVISGEKEAAYIYEGVKATGVITKTSLIMDIGGGSTEFIICTPEGPIWKKSYNIGAARLMQAYFESDPISLDDQATITRHLEETFSFELKSAFARYQPEVLIGSAGAFETFAGMLMKNVDVKAQAFLAIPFEAYKNLARMLIASTHKERAEMKGLIPLRVDMIVMAALLTNYILDQSGVKEINLSTYDLKMGVLHSLLEAK